MSELLAESVTYQSIKDEGRQEGLLSGKRQALQTMSVRLLKRKLGDDLPVAIKQQVAALPVPQLETLCDALLDFKSTQDLTDWLAAHS